MNYEIVQYEVGGHKVLWDGEIEAVPRPGEFITFDPDSASFVVDRVEWDVSDEPRNKVRIFVK